jgi:peptide deformylase
MSVKEIITLENDKDGILSRPTIPVKVMAGKAVVGPHLELIRDIKDTATAIGALGLAANQIGGEFSIMAFLTEGGPLIVINPELVATKDYATSHGERCLSAGGPKDVRRAKTVVVSGFNEGGDPIRMKITKKMKSFAIQHEIDHLNGKTILDVGKE